MMFIWSSRLIIGHQVYAERNVRYVYLAGFGRSPVHKAQVFN